MVRKLLSYVDHRIILYLKGCGHVSGKGTKVIYFKGVSSTVCNQIRVVAFNVPQLTQASFLQKNQMLQNVFLISVALRWHKASVACKNQSF